MRDIEWRGVSMPSANAGTAAMGMANNIFNKALSTAQDGLTKHQEEMEKNNEATKAANTALVLKMKSEGKPVSADFMKQLGVYDGKEINDGVRELKGDQRQETKLEWEIKKITADIASAKAKGHEPSFFQKEMIKSKVKLLEEQAMKEGMYGSYGKGKNGGGSDVKILEGIGVTRHGEDQYGTVDAQNYLADQLAVRKAQAAGISPKNIKLAAAKHTTDGGFWGEVSGIDETNFDELGFLKSLGLK